MPTTGVMQEIRNLLAEGKSSGQLIQMGYAPGTVYKVQRRWRREELGAGQDVDPVARLDEGVPLGNGNGQTADAQPHVRG